LTLEQIIEINGQTISDEESEVDDALGMAKLGSSMTMNFQTGILLVTFPPTIASSVHVIFLNTIERGRLPVYSRSTCMVSKSV
jgi:hypothetical protein